MIIILETQCIDNTFMAHILHRIIKVEELLILQYAKEPV
jgi:hypothetical protein